MENIVLEILKQYNNFELNVHVNIFLSAKVSRKFNLV